MDSMDKLYNEVDQRFKISNITGIKKLTIITQCLINVMILNLWFVIILKNLGVGVLTKTFNLLIDNESTLSSYCNTWAGVIFSIVIISILALNIFFTIKSILKIWDVVCDRFVMVTDTSNNTSLITTTDKLPKVLANKLFANPPEEEVDK